MLKIGQQYITIGGWKAVVCDEKFCTVFHERHGGQLYSHDKNGQIRSNTADYEYSLEYLLTRITSEF